MDLLTYVFELLLLYYDIYIQREVLGIKDFASLQKIDWIFTKCDSLEGGALDFCEQLRSLTLINTTLQFWTSRSFQTVKLTLEHLNLSCQVCQINLSCRKNCYLVTLTIHLL